MPNGNGMVRLPQILGQPGRDKEVVVVVTMNANTTVITNIIRISYKAIFPEV